MLTTIIVVLLVVVPSFPHPVDKPAGLTAYDCSSHAIEKTYLDLSDAPRCQPPANRTSTKVEYVQVLQVSEKVSKQIYSCKIEFHRFSYWCGDLNQVFPQRKMLTVHQVQVTPYVCRNIHNTGVYEYDSSTKISGIVPGTKKYAEITPVGAQTESGRCERGKYSDGDINYSSAVVSGTLIIELEVSVGQISRLDNKIMVKDGICDLRSRGCMTNSGTSYFWEDETDLGCDKTFYSEVYSGSAELLNDTAPGVARVLAAKTGDQLFALPLNEKGEVCGRTAWFSTDKRLVVVYPGSLGAIQGIRRLQTDDVDFMLHLSAKIQYLEHHVSSQMTEMYAAVVRQQCTLYDNQVQTLLTLARVDPTEFATAIYGPGHIAIDYYDKLEITKCVPVLVTLTGHPECIKELPVLYKNETWYVAPRTKVLQKASTARHCSLDSFPSGDLSGAWYDLWPNYKPSESRPPQLSLNMTTTWRYTTVGDLVTRGLYNSQIPMGKF